MNYTAFISKIIGAIAFPGVVLTVFYSEEGDSSNHQFTENSEI